MLCKSQRAEHPFYIESGACHVYSMEELCYFMEQYTYLLDDDFMSADLCGWIEQEQGLDKLANRLRSIRKENLGLREFVFAIEKEVCYATPQTMEEMEHEFLRFEEKPDLECKKLRIDQMVQKKKYRAAIEAYHQLLLSQENMDDVLRGDIWHNLGTAYARMFLFQEASLCYRTAYELNQRETSKTEYSRAVQCMQNAKADEGDAVFEFKQQLEELFQLKKQGEMKKFQQGYLEIMKNWKSEYRRICKK